MSLTRQIASNTILRVAARLVSNVLGVMVVAMLTRYLGQEGFGNYTTIIAYLFFFGALSDLGLYMITINEINQAGVDRLRFYSAVYSLRFYSGVIMMLLAIGAIWFFPYPLAVKQGVMIISLSIIFNLLDQIQVAIYQTELKVARIALAEIVDKLVLIIGVIIGIKLNVNLLLLLWVVVASNGIHWLITLTGVLKRLKFRLTVDWVYWRQIIAKTWPLALAQLFTLIYFKMDTIFISILRPQSIAQVEVGLYGAPYKVLEVLIALVPIFMGLVSPVLSWAWSNNLKERFQEMYQKAFDAFSIVTWPMVLGGMILARPIMDLLAPGFGGSDRILQILMLAIGIIFFAHLPTYVVVTLGEQKRMLPAYAVAAAVATIFYILLIPLYSYWAAAWITVFIEIIILVMAWRRVKAVSKQKMRFAVFNKALLASLVMVAVLWLLSGWNLFIMLVIGGLVYLLVMVLTKGITREMVEKIVYSRVAADK